MLSRLRFALCIFALSVGVGTPLVSLAIVAGQLDDFQDGTTQEWVAALGGGLPPTPPAVVANAGPGGAGDFALRITASGAPTGPGSKLVVNNVETRWMGDYTAAGVEGVFLDVNNRSDVPVTIRVGLDVPPLVQGGGRWVTDGAVVPALSGWRTLGFSLLAEDLLPGDLFAVDPAATLSDVGVIRLLHSTTPSYRGETIGATVDFDNVEAVPEPMVSLGLAMGGVLLAGLARGARLEGTRGRAGGS